MPFYYDHNIPSDAHTFLGQIIGSGVATLAFTPSGTGWVAVGNNGTYRSEGIPQDCFNKLGEFLQQGWAIRCIAFPPAPADSWIIIADKGYYSHNIPNDCFAQIGTMLKAGDTIQCVAFQPSPADAWAVLGAKTY